MNRFIKKLVFGSGKWHWLRHLLFWFFIYLDQILFTSLNEGSLESLPLDIFFFLLDVAMVYFTLYFLMPRFLYKKYFVLFVVLVAILIGINIYIGWLVVGFEEFYIDDYVTAYITTGTLLATAIMIKGGKYAYEMQGKTERLKLEQSELELNFLKKQINPHFLFNVLNTINVQSIADPKSVSNTVIQLSDLLRYQIYDAGKQDKVQLTKEIEFLKNYVSLEKVRRQNITIEWKGDRNVPRIQITPFLFLPLVENAFKHSQTIEDVPTFINFEWQFFEKSIQLKVTNTIGIANEKSPGGFGIENLKKRLDILYPNTHTLSMTAKDGIFTSILKIDTI